MNSAHNTGRHFLLFSFFDWSKIPAKEVIGISAWPDVRDYQNTYATGYANLSNGGPATLYSTFSDQTVDVQFSSAPIRPAPVK